MIACGAVVWLTVAYNADIPESITPNMYVVPPTLNHEKTLLSRNDF